MNEVHQIDAGEKEKTTSIFKIHSNASSTKTQNQRLLVSIASPDRFVTN